MKAVVIKYKGAEVHCYGKVEWDSNFAIVCDDEDYDGYYCDGNPNREDFTFKNWTEVVHHLVDNYREDIVQLEAV